MILGRDFLSFAKLYRASIVFTAYRYHRLWYLTVFIPGMVVLLFAPLLGHAQSKPAETPNEKAAADEPPPADQPTAKIEVKPTTLDTDIAARLQRILEATDWFENPKVEVTEGVVFLEGLTTSNERKEWAGKLAGNTQDVVAVANRMKVRESSIWDFSPAWQEIDKLRRDAIQSLPTLVLSIVLLILTWLAARGFSNLARRIFSRRTSNALLREVLTKAITIPVILLGIYFAIQVTGLTSVAATVLGGTGLIGLVLGIAFRDIAENFLASLLISMHRPFNAGDNIVVEGRTGVVQAVTTRGTMIMTPDGNHVRIPNSIIYKSVIENLTANPKQRQEFSFSIDAQSSISDSQNAILQVLRNHEAVLQNPEPLVLASGMNSSRIILQVYFWIDVRQHAGNKVRSAIIRLTKMAIQELSAKKLPRAATKQAGAINGQQSSESDHASSTPAEGTQGSNAREIEEQAREARPMAEGSDLLKTDSAKRP
jgi:small conductance mechanosensitive channel